MTQIKKFQQGGTETHSHQNTSGSTRPKKKTYYDDLDLVEATASEYAPPGMPTQQREAHAVFEDYPVNYHAYTSTFNDGSRLVRELGRRNGVSVNILNDYNPDGIVNYSDTTYNGLQRGDVGYEHLQRKFEEPYVIVGEPQPLFPGTPGAEIDSPTPSINPISRWRGQKTAQAGVGIKQKGGYFRLQKQGGKLTEVWTSLN